MGLDGLLDIGKSALSAAQQALTVTGHNVANVNTPGYSRQEAVVTERSPVGKSRPGGNGRPGHPDPAHRRQFYQQGNHVIQFGARATQHL